MLGILNWDNSDALFERREEILPPKIEHEFFLLSTHKKFSKLVYVLEQKTIQRNS